MGNKINYNFKIITTRHGSIRAENLPFLLFHLTPIAAFFIDFKWSYVLLALGMYYLRMFFVTGFYHRYFSHRGFKARNRFVQFIMGFLGTTCAQQGPLWWARHHRHHHKYSDMEQDLHSPSRLGFLQSHVLWIITINDAPFYDHNKVLKDLDTPEMHWIDRYWVVGPVALGIALFAIGGLPWLVWGLGISTVLLWHGTFTINSLSHVFGQERYVTGDTSKNNFLLALVTLGEGWHNNHHAYQGGAKAGFYWYEIDITYWLLRVMESFGLIKSMGLPPKRVLDLGRENDENRRRAKALLHKSTVRGLNAHEIYVLLQAVDRFIDRKILRKLNLQEAKRLISELEMRYFPQPTVPA